MNDDENKNQDHNILYIGKKQLMIYVMSLVSNKDHKMRILSRGRNISKSVDVFLIFQRRFAKNVKYEITVGTVVLENRNVSECEINLTWD